MYEVIKPPKGYTRLTISSLDIDGELQYGFIDISDKTLAGKPQIAKLLELAIEKIQDEVLV